MTVGAGQQEAARAALKIARKANEVWTKSAWKTVMKNILKSYSSGVKSHGGNDDRVKVKKAHGGNVKNLQPKRPLAFWRTRKHICQMSKSLLSVWHWVLLRRLVSLGFPLSEINFALEQRQSSLVVDHSAKYIK